VTGTAFPIADVQRDWEVPAVDPHYEQIDDLAHGELNEDDYIEDGIAHVDIFTLSTPEGLTPGARVTGAMVHIRHAGATEGIEPPVAGGVGVSVYSAGEWLEEQIAYHPPDMVKTWSYLEFGPCFQPTQLRLRNTMADEQSIVYAAHIALAWTNPEEGIEESPTPFSLLAEGPDMFLANQGQPFMVPVYLRDQTDGYTPETGVAAVTVFLSKNGSTPAPPNDGDWHEIDETDMPGHYTLSLNAADTSAAGVLQGMVTAAGCRPYPFMVVVRENREADIPGLLLREPVASHENTHGSVAELLSVTGFKTKWETDGKTLTAYRPDGTPFMVLNITKGKREPA